MSKKIQIQHPKYKKRNKIKNFKVEIVKHLTLFDKLSNFIFINW